MDEAEQRRLTIEMMRSAEPLVFRGVGDVSYYVNLAFMGAMTAGFLALFVWGILNGIHAHEEHGGDIGTFVFATLAGGVMSLVGVAMMVSVRLRRRAHAKYRSKLHELEVQEGS